MGVKQWVGASIIINLFKTIRKSGRIHDVAQSVDAALDKAFPKHSENIQRSFGSEFLLPLGRELMREDGRTWVKVLQKEMDAARKILRAQGK